ncbi:hypothetical protein BAUCODRAFT_23873 [Baudoinia panamericana UAMH 10762]|uniref:Uncharacterized protein n=1 Tax=Baudoinia panamericana (strain UAMH 10762) TaxID=717646 RepID=M2MLS5_BAUPA|nr:uncharacterized protein BAUCODRAFT_23873 [Baudoinia panamericana UAMH 10762]EMC97611.1 hypothetical protein BAUCODRAFT_23873 [Baudoinia panamericana UAMH 10762]
MGLGQHKGVQQLHGLFNTLFHGQKGTEGLYWLSIWSADASLGINEFNGVVQGLLVPRILKDNGVLTALRICNTSPNARGGTASNGYKPQQGGPCVLLVRIQDVEMLWTSPALQKLAIGRRDRDEPRVFGTEARTYELIQRFEGKKGAKVKGNCIVAVLIEPGDGQGEEIEQWYQKENLALLARIPPFIRTTRYRSRSGLVHGANDHGPTLLSLHEYTTHRSLLDHTIQFGPVIDTPWAKRIFAAAKSVERTIWDVTGKYTQTGSRLDGL